MYLKRYPKSREYVSMLMLTDLGITVYTQLGENICMIYNYIYRERECVLTYSEKNNLNKASTIVRTTANLNAYLVEHVCMCYVCITVYVYYAYDLLS